MTTQAVQVQDAGMPEGKQIAVRMPRDLIDRVDAYAARLVRQTPGLRLSQAAVVKLLVERGLAAVEADEKPRKK